MFTVPTELALLAIGLAAGVLGGMLGIGGGLVMIPAMAILLGDRFGPNSFHLYKLAAIGTSVVLSIPAVIRHHRAGATVWRIVWATLPLALVGAILGVAAAGLLSGDLTGALKRAFGAFLVAVVAFNVYRGVQTNAGGAELRDRCPLPARRRVFGLVVGFPAGLIAGLLGIAGGVWAVPAQRLLLGVRLRNAIANSSGLIVGVAALTALSQSIAVVRIPPAGTCGALNAADGWLLAAWLAPGALLGGWLGATLTHLLPLTWVRHAFHVLLAITGLRLLIYA